jgi:hypothetical protein
MFLNDPSNIAGAANLGNATLFWLALGYAAHARFQHADALS